MERLFEFLTDLSGGVAYLLIFGILVACGLGFPL
ncbi:MAG: DedA family protein, partial [Proteobacteria bacterium]|nr:DedA family protein [Pseudomonadota bacterium]